MTEQHLIEEQLAELAATVTVGPPPVARLLAGGRRRRLRRRATAATATLVALGVLGGGAWFGLGQTRTEHGVTLQAAAPPSAAPSPGSTDPFTPTRAMLADGVLTNGRHWQAWAALWPAGTREQAFQQARLIWLEQHAADASLPEPTEAFARQYWNAGDDKFDLYLVVDGVRQPLDSVASIPRRTASAPPVGDDGSLPGSAVGRQAKNGPGSADNGLGSTSVVFAQTGPDIAKAVLVHPDGSSTELRPTTVGDSPVHWLAFARSEQTQGSRIELYAASGLLVATNDQWFK